MALASLGALIAMSVAAWINSRIRRDFAFEWQQSLKIRSTAALAEMALEADAASAQDQPKKR